MRKNKLILILLMVFVLGFSVFIACSDKTDNPNSGGETPEPAKEYTVAVSVQDNQNVKLLGAKVKLGDKAEKTTPSNGNVSFENVEEGEHSLTISKTGYIDVTQVINTTSAVNGVVDVIITLEEAQKADLYQVNGTITNQAGSKLENVKIMIVGKSSIVSDSNGQYSIGDLELIDSITLEEQDVLISFTHDDFIAVTKTIKASDYIDSKILVLDIILEKRAALPNKTMPEIILESAVMQEPILTATNLSDIETLATYNWQYSLVSGAKIEKLTEGIRIESGEESTDFRGYIYAKKTIDDTSDTLTIYARTFSGNKNSYALKVIDLETGNWEYIKQIGSAENWNSFASESYVKIDFDLSEFSSKTVVLVFGVRKAAITIESIQLSGVANQVIFGRTTQLDANQLNTIELNNSIKYTAISSTNKIQDVFGTMGNAKVDNNRWLLIEARGGEDDADSPYSYIYSKMKITRASALLTVRESNYNNAGGDNKGLGKLKVFAYSVSDNSLLASYVQKDSDTSGEWTKSTFDLSEIIDETVYLVVGFSYGNRMGIDYIDFARVNYLLKGTVTLPNDTDYTLDDVSFVSDDFDIDVIDFNKSTGEFIAELDIYTGTFKVVYDNDKLGNGINKIIEYSINLEDLSVVNTTVLDITLLEELVTPIDIFVTLKIDGGDIVVSDTLFKLTIDTVEYNIDSSITERLTFKIGDLLLAEAQGKTITITPMGNNANIYKVVNHIIKASDYSQDKAQIEITINYKEVLPNLTIANLKKANELNYDFYAGRQSESIFDAFNIGQNSRLDKSQNEGQTLQTIENSSVDTDNYNSFIYAKKNIESYNCTFKITMRTHKKNYDIAFAITVIDLLTGDIKVFNEKKGNTSYETLTYDLSDFIGKTVVIAIGIYKSEIGEDEQLALYTIEFQKGAISDEENVIANLTYSQLNSSKVNTLNSFEGIGKNGNRWDNSDHIRKNWATVFTGHGTADTEKNPGEGYLIKTQGSAVTEKENDPNIFIYAKFSITDQNSLVHTRARSFSNSKNVDTALIVFSDSYKDGIAIAPKDFDTSRGIVGADNWILWDDNNNTYVEFYWDLSEFEGQDIVIVIGVRNKTTSGENKMAMQKIELQENI